MKKKSTVKNKTPLKPRIIVLLLKKAMSQSDLAIEIYGKQNRRSAIAKNLVELEKEKIIKRRATPSRKILYTTNLETLGKFNEEEYDFIKLIIQRFWNPLQEDSIDSLKNLLLNTYLIQKGYKINQKLFSYNPEKDLNDYEKNKKKFWEDMDFREKFLDKIKRKEEKLKRKTFPLRKDYILCCLIAPDTLSNKIYGEHKRIINPFSISINILNNLNNQDKLSK